jgi:hypothetical protein
MSKVIYANRAALYHAERYDPPEFFVSHTIPSGLSNSILITFITHSNALSLTTPQWEGQSMTFLDDYSARNMLQSIYYFPHPTAGTRDMTFSLSSGGAASIISVTLAGVNLINPFGAVAGENTPNAKISIAVPPDAGVFRLGGVSDRNYQETIGVGTDQVHIGTIGASGTTVGCFALSYKNTGTTTMSFFTADPSDKLMQAFVVNPTQAPFIGMNIDQVSIKPSSVNQKLFLTDNGAQTNNQLLVGEETTIDKNYISFPRLTTTERDALSSPTAGTVLWNITTARLEIYNGSGWVAV